MPPPNPQGAGNDPLYTFGAQMAQQILTAMNARSERDGAIKMHPVERRRNGKKEVVAATLPQLLAELNDNIVDLIECVDENCEDILDAIEEQGGRREKKRKGGRRIKAERIS